MRTVGTGTFKTTEYMRNLVNQVLDSGRISYGPLSLAFEKRFAALHQCAYAILSNSGTSSLHVALQALKEIHNWGWGQVIVPATTFVATPNIVTHNSMTPVFVDVDPVTYNLNPALLEAAITVDTRAIIPVHLFGQPANMTEIRAVADKRGLKIIEDSCETMFVKHGNQVVGSWGDIGCFSTYVAHLVVTGVGGLATTNVPEYASKMRSLVNHGLTMENLNPGENFSPRPMLGRRFTFDTTGHSYRLTEFEAAVGLAQLQDYEQMLALRRRNARHLSAGIKLLNESYGDWFQAPETAEGNEHAWMMYPIVLKRGGEIDKYALTQHLNSAGIETRDMLPLLGQPAFKFLASYNFPVSARLVTHGFYVGIHQGLDPDDIQYIIDGLGSWADKGYTGKYITGIV